MAEVGAAQRTSSRDPVIDVLRGVCVVSMVLGHAAEHSLVGTLAHLPKWVDGSYGFVAISGFVLGLVHRRGVARDGVRATRRKLLDRAARLYGLHVATLLLVVLAASAGRPILEVRAVHQLGGGAPALLRILALRYQPFLFDILPMYVVLLLALALVLPLLARGALGTTTLLVGACYACSIPLRDASLAVPALNGRVHVPWTLSAWQLVFFGGVLLGWTWAHERLAVPVAVRRGVVQACVVVAVGLLVLARLGGDALQHELGWWVSKPRAGLLAAVDAGALLTTAYVAVRWLRVRLRVLGPVLGVLERHGARTLVAFVASSLLICGSELLDVTRRLPGDAKALLCLLATGVVVELFVRRDERRAARARLAAATSVPAPKRPAIPAPVAVATVAAVAVAPAAGVPRAPRRSRAAAAPGV